MEKLRMLLQDCCNERLYQIVISNPRRKEEVQKIKIRPVMLKGSLVFQESAYTATQVFHHNRSAGELIERICQVMEQDFKQLEMSSKDSCATVLVGKKGNVTVRKKQTREGATSKSKAPVLEHNRKKQYILEEGVPVGFLQDLGVQTADGRIVRSGMISLNRSIASLSLWRISSLRFQKTGRCVLLTLAAASPI